MEAVSGKSEDGNVSAQANGQNDAIKQQLSSGKIVNVVSSTKIWELPDDIINVSLWYD